MTEVKGDVVICVTRCDDRGFLVVQRSEEESFTGRWEFPGGIVEDGESLEKAAFRELEEEAAIRAEVMREGESYVGEGSTGYWMLHPFLLETEGRGKVETSPEHQDYRWIKISELEEMNTMGQMKALERLEVVE